MTFENIKKQVGKNLKYYNDTDGWITSGKDVTETDIGEMINQLYRDDIFPMLATQYPYYFRQEATADSWIATGTVDATSTSTTLVTTTAIFTNSMIGLWVYNNDLETSAKIEAFTSTTTVTLSETIGDTWDGDTIYVLGQEFVLGGEATDAYVIEAVGLKYQQEATYFTLTGNPRPKFDFFQYGGEIANPNHPQVYLTTVKVGGVQKDALGILPGFNAKVTKAIQINYIAKPAVMSSGTDEPRFYSDIPLIYGATARAFMQRQMFQEASQWQGMYEKAKREAISRFRSTSTGTPKIGRMPRSTSLMHRRLI